MSKRHSWTNAYKDFALPGMPAGRGTGRPKRTPTARVIQSCVVVKTEEADGTIYESTSGGWIKVSKNAVVVCLPYPVSANALWRASRSEETNKQTNVLSIPARQYKTLVFNQFAPLFRAIGWPNLTELCEVRIVVQPPCRRDNYNIKTYPRYDVDNYSKPVLDCLKGKDLLFQDDRIFVSEKVEFAEPYKNGRVWLSCVKLDDVDWLNRRVPHQWLAGAVELI